MKIIEVNIVRFKPLERTFKRTADGFRTRIEPLLKQISSYMTEIDDEFKQVLVRALLALSVKFPEKYDVLLSFLSKILKNVGIWLLFHCRRVRRR